MSAHAYILYVDVPERLVDSALRHYDAVTGADLIAFDECPFSGEFSQTERGALIEFPWPHNQVLRSSLSDWLTHHGINFTVVM
jgi:hypothetical protein